MEYIEITKQEIADILNCSVSTMGHMPKFIQTRKKNNNIDIVYSGKNRGNAKLYNMYIPDENKDEWKDCPGAEDFYLINKSGELRDKETNRIRVGCINSDGYRVFEIRRKDYKKAIQIHRALMIAFNPIENPENYVVDHINGKRDDNRLENLRWVTNAQNIKYKDINQTNINELQAKLIQKYGYDELIQKLNELLED